MQNDEALQSLYLEGLWHTLLCSLQSKALVILLHPTAMHQQQLTPTEPTATHEMPRPPFSDTLCFSNPPSTTQSHAWLVPATV